MTPCSGLALAENGGTDDLFRVGWWADFHAASASRRDRPAVVDAHGAVSWAELAARVARVAESLHRAGLGRGDVVVTALHNGRECIELTLACARIGAVIAPVSYRQVPRELRHVIELARPRLLVADRDLADVVAEASVGAAHRVVLVGDDGPGGYAALTAPGASTGPHPGPGPTDPLWFAFTGGTTGRPKACVGRHRTLLLNWLLTSQEFPISGDDVLLLCAPYYHSQAFMFTMHHLMVGGTVVVQRRFDPAEALAEIARSRVSVLVMAPTLYEMLLDAPDAATADLSSVRTMVTAGAPLRTSTKERIHATFPHGGLHEYYGSTEIGFATILPPVDQRRKTRCVGRPFFGMTVAVVDADGRELPPGEVGEVGKRGLMIAPEYLGDPEATRAQFRPGGWMTAGDLGYADEEGYVHLVDRTKDVIISGGANVYATEVEDVIALHPDVREVAVVGVPDRRWGELVKAVVVARPGSGLTGPDVQAHCAAQLSGAKRPRLVELRDDLPKNPVGKVEKSALRTGHWAEHT
jgi:acyl-CoA synthetase (AMP-forming)/AMP-acid ligase II